MSPTVLYHSAGVGSEALCFLWHKLVVGRKARNRCRELGLVGQALLPSFDSPPTQTPKGLGELSLWGFGGEIWFEGRRENKTKEEGLLVDDCAISGRYLNGG